MQHSWATRGPPCGSLASYPLCKRVLDNTHGQTCMVLFVSITHYDTDLGVCITLLLKQGISRCMLRNSRTSARAPLFLDSANSVNCLNGSPLLDMKTKFEPFALKTTIDPSEKLAFIQPSDATHIRVISMEDACATRRVLEVRSLSRVIF